MRQGKGLVLCLVCAFSALSMAATAPAQGTALVVGSTLAPGGQVTVTYSSPGAGGESVLVLVDDGGDETLWDYVVIRLDDHGRGSATWTVPTGWEVAVFTAKGAPPVARVIEET